MARQRPLAGQRSRARLGPAPTGVLDRPAPTEARPAPGPDAAPRPPRTRRVLGQVRAGRPRRRFDLLLLGALVVVVALVLTAATLTLRARAADRTERARTAAVAAAESDAADLLSYDYRHLDRDFARARAELTGRFARDYRRTTETVVRPTARQVKAVVTADVVASSVVRASQDRVVVLLFVNQTTTSTRVDGPRVDLNRVRMTMQRVDGRWLVGNVSAL